MRYRTVSSSALLLCVAVSTGFAQVRRQAPGVPTLKPVPPPVLSSLTLSHDSISGKPSPTQPNGKVTLSGPAPAGGLEVTLSADNAAATVPANVVVAAGATEATFQVSTKVVSAPTAVQITAQAATVSMSATLKVLLTVVSAQLQAHTVWSTERIWRITMSGPAPAAGIMFQPLVVGVPDPCYPLPMVSAAPIAGGDTSGVLTVQAGGPGINYQWRWEFPYGGRVWRSFFGFSPPDLVAIDFPATLVGGTTGYGTVRLDGKTPSAGCATSPLFSVQYDRLYTMFFSSNSAAVQVPASARVDPLQSERLFSITTSTVQTPQTATITVSRTNYNGVQTLKQVTITVTP